MPKVVRSIGSIFLLVGLLFAGVGAWNFWHSSQLSANGQQAQGQVVEIERRRNNDGKFMYRPVVEFRDNSGVRYEFVSKHGSNPAAFSRGERVKVIYDPWDPSDAMIDSFSTRFLFPLMIASFGSLFAAIGGWLIYLRITHTRIIASLKQLGVPLQASFQQCERDYRTKINGRSPYHVFAQATHPATGKITSFKSPPIWINLTSTLENKEVPVLIDPSNPKHYHVDLSQWVSEDEFA